MVLLSSIGRLMCATIDQHNDKVCNFVLKNFTHKAQKNSKNSFGTAEWRPLRHGLSIPSSDSNGMLAPHRSSNSRCAVSDSWHLRMIPHVRFSLRTNFLLYVFSRCRFLKCSVQCSIIFCTLIKGFPCT